MWRGGLGSGSLMSGEDRREEGVCDESEYKVRQLKWKLFSTANGSSSQLLDRNLKDI